MKNRILALSLMVFSILLGACNASTPIPEAATATPTLETARVTPEPTRKPIIPKITPKAGQWSSGNSSTLYTITFMVSPEGNVSNFQFTTKSGCQLSILNAVEISALNKFIYSSGDDAKEPFIFDGYF